MQVSLTKQDTNSNILSLLDDVYQYAESLDEEDREFICSRIKTIESLMG